MLARIATCRDKERTHDSDCETPNDTASDEHSNIDRGGLDNSCDQGEYGSKLNGPLPTCKDLVSSRAFIRLLDGIS